ncbi:cytochrome c oxidase subunit 3 [Pseudochelatococcus contaminans]|nr:cytochrome c oxidase subunit 3 [Pseudochelatococcus contaminans]
MQSTAKQHDYHIVDPSPWPLVLAVSLFVLSVGAVLTMTDIRMGEFAPGPYVLGVGVIGLLGALSVWWIDVIREGQRGAHTRVVALHHRYGMILFIITEVMFFVAWFWAFFDASLFPGEAIQFERVEATGGQWPPAGIETFDPWHLPLFNTLVLLTSGTMVTLAYEALLKGDRRGIKLGLWATLVLAALFIVVQAYEYSHATFAFSGNIYGSTFFMTTGVHGVHVIVGTVFLAICLLRVYLGHFTAERHLGFELAAWYWHFVDVVWLFLFAAIYVWGAGG